MKFFDILANYSREANCKIFGDCSGATISRRKANDFNNFFNLSDNSIIGRNAVHIVHFIMFVVFLSILFIFRKAIIAIMED